MQEIWDSHVHLLLSNNPDIIKTNGISYPISISECLPIINMSKKFTTDIIYLFLGAHPWYVKELDMEKVREVLGKCPNKILGHGRIGFDKRGAPDMKVQLRLLGPVSVVAARRDRQVMGSWF